MKMYNLCPSLSFSGLSLYQCFKKEVETVTKMKTLENPNNEYFLSLSLSASMITDDKKCDRT